MLFKLQNSLVKLTKVKLLFVILCSYFICITKTIADEDSFSDKLQVHGFIAQGIIDVNGSNYVNDDQDISFKLTEIGLNASYQISPDIRIAAQAVYLNGGNRYIEGLRLDHLLLEWALYNSENWQTNLYLGRIKNYHWLYSSTRDVPMTRPSIILPQSVYFDGTRDMSVGGNGAAITTRYSSESLGNIDLYASVGYSEISRKQTDLLMGNVSTGKLTHEEDFQASIYWQPSQSQWKFGLATTIADFSYKQGDNDIYIEGILELKRLYANAEYQGENWTFSAEIVQEHKVLTGFLAPSFVNDTTGQGGFLQAQYRISPQIQLLGRFEHYYADKNDKNGRTLEQNSGGLLPHYFGYQDDLTIGLNYNLSSNMQIQLEYHAIKGTARLTPVLIPDPATNNQEHWQLWAAQFMYWF